MALWRVALGDGRRRGAAAALSLRCSSLTRSLSAACGGGTALDLCRLPVTCGSSGRAHDAAAAINNVMHEYLSLKGDPVGAARQAIEADEACVLAQCAVGLFHCIGQSKPLACDAIRGSLQRALAVEKKGGVAGSSPRDRAFIAALQHWSQGHIREAVNSLEHWIAIAPRDILALRICQDGYLFLGDSTNCRDLVGRVLPMWQPSDFGYAYAMGMFAFGLVECGDLVGAEQWADRALGANKEDIWALHAKAHVLEMAGRANEGQSLLRHSADEWGEANLLSNHMAWHECMFYLDHGNERAIKRIYEERMRPALSGDGSQEPQRARKTSPFPLTDCSSLLWRMELNNMSVSDEWWEELGQAWTYLDSLQLSTFNDLHTLMVYSALAGRGQGEWKQRAEAMVDRLASLGEGHGDASLQPESSISSHHPGRWRFAKEPDNAWVSRSIGVHVARSLLAYQLGDFEAACNYMLPVRHHLGNMGGSHAQRDVFHLTLLEASLRIESEVLGRVLAAERVSWREGSAQAWDRFARVLGRAGNMQGALEAGQAAHALGLGQGGKDAH